MDKNDQTLIIVESPSMARTINRYLGDGYVISSSMGHIIDLPKSRLAVDVEHGFAPEYITIRGKAKILKELKKKASQTGNVLLATAPDREGEAISWHLSNALRPINGNIRRIEFNEITEGAIREAVNHPRDINMDLVNAQQARRILESMKEAEKTGAGAVTLDGKMIDIASIRQAETTVKMAELAAAKEAS
jgi:DNA topoisomerase-1